MRIDFDAKTHSYFVNGDIASISITELLKKHGLAPNLSFVSEEKLEESRANGKIVHADIENYINFRDKEYIPETPQGLEFAKWADENLKEARAEVMVTLDWGGMIVAGTIDLLGVLKSGERVIDDHKNTASANREYVAWQVSIGDYMARQMNGRIVNDRKFVWKGAKKFLCTHFDPKSGKLTVKELEKIPDTEIEKLFTAEFKGEKYMRPALAVPDEMCLELNAAEETLIFYEKAYKAAKERSDKVRAALTAEMERQGVFTYESDRLKVSYRAASESVIVDSTRLKREQPQVFAAYSKISKRKATVFIAVKGEEENGEVQEN